MRKPLITAIVTLALLCLLAATLRLDVVITSGSMENTLFAGDYVLVEKLAYTSSPTPPNVFMLNDEPKDGEIVMFRSPTEAGQTFIKRIVGVPGDHLRMIARVLYRNGRRVAEPYVSHIYDPSITAWNVSLDNFPASVFVPDQRELLHSDIFGNHVVNGEIVIPPGAIS